MTYEIGKDLQRLQHELNELCSRHDAHVADGHSSEVGEHDHEVSAAEVAEVVVAAAEALAVAAEEAPAEVQAEVEEAAEAAEEAAVEVVEALETAEVEEEAPERVHPLYRRL